MLVTIFNFVSFDIWWQDCFGDIVNEWEKNTMTCSNYSIELSNGGQEVSSSSLISPLNSFVWYLPVICLGKGTQAGQGICPGTSHIQCRWASWPNNDWSSNTSSSFSSSLKQSSCSFSVTTINFCPAFVNHFYLLRQKKISLLYKKLSIIMFCYIWMMLELCNQPCSLRIRWLFVRVEGFCW